ncbi:sodium-dependent bicarbonate transport family permease [Desertibacillus haloalkaliphilus]|uniref:sodium-dependent bicarbonate transport family permease n=1 Tax=Desertibacillus haloalkaliphilus TaxID=1328930 RepID=UPI001C2603A1|nr:sodium-dependent bicarbonate transport family permease [Desertibacillus haloalkaliphilus]MBU8908837.1 sodium-dependent bicarbonate transport family permease [Desertibacillus haloalkaliphilus]
MIEIITENLLSPVVLFFVLGLIAAIFKSDLTFPKGLSEALSIYLLVAIGLKGGIELSNYTLEAVIQPIAGTLFLGIATPILTLIILRFTLKLDINNAIGLAATYGSVSIVTYGAALSFLENHSIGYESFMNAMVVLMEIPAILVALFIYGAIKTTKKQPMAPTKQVGITATPGLSWIDKDVLKESFFGKSVLLLVGSLFIGLIVGKDGLPVIEPLFIDLYNSVLMLFLLNMGIMAGERLDLIKKHGIKLVLFGICIPILYGVIGVLVGYAVNLSLGGMTLMGVLAASASYIAAPAALKTSVPHANPSIYLGLALGITFPFNLILGIPIYFTVAQWIA